MASHVLVVLVSVSGTGTPPLADDSKVLRGAHNVLERPYPTLGPGKEAATGLPVIYHSQAD